MPLPSQSSSVHHPSNTRGKEDIMKLLIIQIHQRPIVSSILGPDILFSNLFSNNFILC
jgi:hypothetical protein